LAPLSIPHPHPPRSDAADADADATDPVALSNEDAMAIVSLVSRAARAATLRAGATRGFSVLTAAEEFDGIPATSPAPKKGSVSSVTTLPSGLTIVTEDASLTSTVTLTYPNAGSSNEGPTEAGAALANRYLSFKSGSELSSAVILRELEDVGASVFSSAGRRGATLGFTAARENAALVAPLLATTCSFEKWDVKDAQNLAGLEAAEATSNAQVRHTATGGAVAVASCLCPPNHFLIFCLLLSWIKCTDRLLSLIKFTRLPTDPIHPWDVLTTPLVPAAPPSCRFAYVPTHSTVLYSLLLALLTMRLLFAWSRRSSPRPLRKLTPRLLRSTWEGRDVFRLLQQDMLMWRWRSRDRLPLP
ncbi:hypothetical protein ACHAWF_008585, partial [Thalassiosira exigua]